MVIKDEQEFVEFSCRDSEGSIGIDPKGAEFSTQLKSKKRVGRQTHYEWHIAESSALYILGSAVIDKEKGDESTLFATVVFAQPSWSARTMRNYLLSVKPSSIMSRN